jgi:hypothetical protein
MIFSLVLKTEKAKRYHISGPLRHDSDACDQIETNRTEATATQREKERRHLRWQR